MKYLYYFLIAITAVIAYYVTYYIFGKQKNIAAKELSNTHKNKIKECGIIHYTKREYAEEIIKQGVFKPSNRIKSYSSGLKKSVHFFIASHYNDKSIEFNIINLDCYIKITGLTENQLNNIKIRGFDKTLVYTGEFVIESENNCFIEESKETKLKSKGIFKGGCSTYRIYIKTMLKVLLFTVPGYILFIFILCFLLF